MAPMDGVALDYSQENSGRNIQNVSRKRTENTCYPITDPEIRKFLAWLHVTRALKKGVKDDHGITFAEDHEVPEDDMSSDGYDEWYTAMQAQAEQAGVGSIGELQSDFPFTFTVLVAGNLPTQICGSDAMDAEDLIEEELRLRDLNDIYKLDDALASGEEFNPHDMTWAIYVVFIMIILEFLLLVALRAMAGPFGKWPLSMIYTFVRKFARRVIRKMRDWAFQIIPGMETEDDELRTLQIQKILLFANGNQLVEMGKKLGIV